MDFKGLRRLFSDLGATKFYAKELAENDNSKNQVYLGPGFEALNIIPNKGIVADIAQKKKILKARLDFSWVAEDGQVSPAPRAQLILYPQYPEVRFSGFLLGARNAPSALMAGRAPGRILFLGISPDNRIFAMAVPASSIIASEYRSLGRQPDAGVFVDLTVPSGDGSRVSLLKELKRISDSGWIRSKRLNGAGNLLPCNAMNCGGFTLEAELGIRPNGFSEPDFLGWEIKQHAVTNFNHMTSGVITLMTPEPTGGIYSEEGPEVFIRKFGYPDKAGRPDRLNFGGVHRSGERHPLTGLTLKLIGYNNETRKMSDESGGIGLLSDSGELAAFWPFSGLLTHWVRKHSKAAYIPSLLNKAPLSYKYCDRVRLAVKTDFLRFLKAMDCGQIYYDPGLKIEQASTRPKVKRRNQFRIKSSEVGSLYESLDIVQL